MTARPSQPPYYDIRPRPPSSKWAQWIPPAADNRTTTYHEAGHACVAIDQKIEFTTVEINVSDGGGGCIQYADAEEGNIWRLLQDGHHQEPHVIDWVERNVVMLFAGMMAQRRYAPNSDWRGDGVPDLKNITTWMQRLIAGPPDYGKGMPHQQNAQPPFPTDIAWWYPPERIIDINTLNAACEPLARRSKALVRELWPEIKIVAAALVERVVLSEAEVRKLMSRARRK
jgi:hypothetical protein